MTELFSYAGLFAFRAFSLSWKASAPKQRGTFFPRVVASSLEAIPRLITLGTSLNGLPFFFS